MSETTKPKRPRQPRKGETVWIEAVVIKRYGCWQFRVAIPCNGHPDYNIHENTVEVDVDDVVPTGTTVIAYEQPIY